MLSGRFADFNDSNKRKTMWMAAKQVKIKDLKVMYPLKLLLLFKINLMVNKV